MVFLILCSFFSPSLLYLVISAIFSDFLCSFLASTFETSLFLQYYHQQNWFSYFLTKNLIFISLTFLHYAIFITLRKSSLCTITKRRKKKSLFKLHMIDLCSLIRRLNLIYWKRASLKPCKINSPHFFSSQFTLISSN